MCLNVWLLITCQCYLSPDLGQCASPAGLLTLPSLPALPSPPPALLGVPRLPLVPGAQARDELPELRQAAPPLAVVRGRGGAAH